MRIGVDVDMSKYVQINEGQGGDDGKCLDFRKLVIKDKDRLLLLNIKIKIR